MLLVNLDSLGTVPAPTHHLEQLMREILVTLYAVGLATAASTAYSFYTEPSTDVQSEALTCARMQAGAQSGPLEQQEKADGYCAFQRKHQEAVRKSFSQSN